MSSREALRAVDESWPAPAFSVENGPYPRTVHIRNFRSDRYRLTEDLAVAIDGENGQVVASSYDTDQYGYGPTAELAIEHLCAVLEDYYELLLEDQGRLSPRLESHLRYLESVLAPR
ncbi:MAG TPA: hypothetical protein VKK31_28100 [Thermoanaerobaculia bacterium]|nr:hypothetical protein [Thermoanaerobaculia bacterium]